MNPYDFVRIDWSKTPIKRRPTWHHKFEGVSGKIEGTITTETALFLPQAKPNINAPSSPYFLTNGQQQTIIPGSSLKGLFRSLVETIGPGCWCLYRGDYRDRIDYSNKLPQAFQPCSHHNQLCPACRMFGLINRGTLLQGHVNFDDAVCEEPVGHDMIYTPILDAPKPRHKAWYLDDSEKNLAGRKLYFHQTRLNTLSQQKRSRSGIQLNQKIKPIGQGSIFTFSAQFNSLNPQDELPLLLYAIVLEPTMRHKLGYAKPAGLGSIKVDLTKLTLIDYSTRYTTEVGGMTVYRSNQLADYLEGQTRPFVSNIASITLQDLRRIWGWPPNSELFYTYPDRNWFNENPNAPIAET